jgi:hypothetical protein
MSKGDKQPVDVFTPRRADVNPSMYIRRDALEQQFRRELSSYQHILLWGESGTGKSWLYQQVLKDVRAHYETVNLATASRLGSIGAAIEATLNRRTVPVREGYEEGKTAELNAGLAKGAIAHSDQYSLPRAEPFERLLKQIRDDAKDRIGVLVIDNLERADTEALRRELADMIILCDDRDYAKYKIRLVIVGVPHGIRDYLFNTPSIQSVSNRLTELPAVASLSTQECRELAYRGFVHELKYSFEDLDGLLNAVVDYTWRIPLFTQQYCLQIAQACEQDRFVMRSAVKSSAATWITSKFSDALAHLDANMNERDTKAGRRNQVLFAIGRSEAREFKASEIEAIVRKEFAASTAGRSLSVGQILFQLAAASHPIIRSMPNTHTYGLVDPRYRAVIRTSLVKTSDGRVERT